MLTHLDLIRQQRTDHRLNLQDAWGPLVETLNIEMNFLVRNRDKSDAVVKPRSVVADYPANLSPLTGACHCTL
jgi:hypothetical protein